MPKKTLFFVGYPAILALGTMKGQTLLPRLLWICLISRLVYPILILFIILISIFFSFGKMIGMVRSQTSFILPSQSWEIGSPTGSAGRMKLSCRAFNGHTHLTHSYILRKDPPPLCEHHQCVLTVYHILVYCNHFGGVQLFC